MKSDKCRVCMIDNADICIFTKKNNETLNIAAKIMACTNANIASDDKLPSKICNSCVNNLNISYEFKLQCEDTDIYLRNCHIEENSQAISQESFINCDDSVESLSSKNDVDCKEIISPKKQKKECQESSSNIIKTEVNYDDKTNLRKVKRDTKEQCFTCGKVMSSRFRLKMHMRIHTGEKPFVCKFCQKSFTLSQNLKVHERVHTGDKPLICSICKKTFAQSSGLVAHMRLHTGEMPYRCNLCPSSFRTPGHLQYHIRQHTGEKKHQCTTCSRAFISRSDLTQHLKTHTGERRFVCNICGLRMSRSSHLTRHMMTHTGEKPHRCDVCGLSYAQKGDLSRHVKKHLFAVDGNSEIENCQKSTIKVE